MDIVERLREFEATDCCGQRKQAADAIERLREALNRIANYEGGPVDLIWENMAEIARSALQQKESEQ